jgi:hypothetical protein
LKKSELRKIIKEELLKEKFGDMAKFTIGAERDGDFENIQLMIHGNKIMASKRVPLNSKLYEQLFDYCTAKLRR